MRLNTLNHLSPDAELGPALQALIVRADRALDQCLPRTAQAPTTLHQAMRYAVLGGGKRLRPLLVYATAQALGNNGLELDALACAVELIHAYSLVHDDLPAMDNDALRRGRPTCHVAFGEAMAILAGDALQALAFELLASDPAAAARPATLVQMLRELGQACGAGGMAGGQALDLSAIGCALTLPERRILGRLMTGDDEPVSRDVLIAMLTEDTFDFDPHRLEMFVYRLRCKVAESCGETLPLRAVRGVGYVLTR